MDAQKTGALIRRIRTEKRMTQKELATYLHVSDKAISKWERGAGCPDIALIEGLSAALGVDAQSLLTGDEKRRKESGGNMRRMGFYVCPVCQNVLTATAAAEISCCSLRLKPLIAQPIDDKHRPTMTDIEGETYLTVQHPMEKSHFIRFIACVGSERVLLVRLYPEQGAEMRIPHMARCKLLICCSEDGLFECSL